MEVKKKREKGTEFRTPIATAVWPKLDVADTKFATAEKPHGHFSIGLILPLSDPAVAAMVEKLEELRQEALAEGQAAMKPGKRVKEAQYGWQPEMDEAGQETGNVIINLKKSGGFTKEDGTVIKFSVDVFDTKGNKIPKATLAKMGSGSKVRAIFETGKFATGLGAGVSLKLRAVQVIELVEFGSRDASGYGFETTGGGFVAEESAPATGFDNPSGQDATVGDDSDI